MLALALAGVSFLAVNCSAKTDNKESTEQDGAEVLESDAASDNGYACPMHPEVTGKEGDTCSKCNMALVKVGEESDTTMMHDNH